MNTTLPNIEILPLKTTEVLPIRQTVMWPHKPLSYVAIPNDDSAMHYGLLVAGKITSIISLFYNNKKVQFRKFATLTNYQGLGYGSLLLEHIMKIVAQEQIHAIWCNARIEKIGYYKKFDLIPTPQTFDKDGISYVIMEKKICK